MIRLRIQKDGSQMYNARALHRFLVLRPELSTQKLFFTENYRGRRSLLFGAILRTHSCDFVHITMKSTIITTLLDRQITVTLGECLSKQVVGGRQ